MSEKQKSSFVFTPENESIPNEINPNESEEVKFSFSNFSTHFDEHINKSIRGYSDLRNDVVKISEYFVENDTTVMDLGCSQGSLLRRMKEQNSFVQTTKYLGIEINDSFSEHWKEEENLKYLCGDVSSHYPSSATIRHSISIKFYQFLL